MGVCHPFPSPLIMGKGRQRQTSSLAHEREYNWHLSHENFFRKTSLCGIPGDNGEGMQ